jgi:hypothetical protein
VTFSNGQDSSNPISTDRLGASDTSTLVSRRILQLETGGLYVNSSDLSSSTDNYTYNLSLFRYGILDNMELRLAAGYQSTTLTDKFTNTDQEFHGITPLRLGTKIGITKADGWKPQVSFVGMLSLPFAASSDLKPDTTGMDFRFLFDHFLSDRSSFGYNIGARLGPDDPESAYIYVVTYSYSFRDHISFFTNVYGDLPEHSTANHLWDAGFTYLANNDLQFDLSVGSGITAGQDLLLGAGLSYRCGPL